MNELLTWTSILQLLHRLSVASASRASTS